MIGGAGSGGDMSGVLIWGIIGLAWLGLTLVTLRALWQGRAQGGPARAALWLAAALLVAVALAPAWFMAAGVLISIGSSGPEGAMGAGGAMIGIAVFGGLASGLVVASVCALRAGRQRGPA